MANKSFVVQYLIKARDNFSRAAETVSNSSDRMRRIVDKTQRTFSSLSNKSAVLKRKIAAVISPMAKLTAQATKLKAKLKAVEERFTGLSSIGTKLRNMGAGMTAVVTLPAGLAAFALKNAARDAEETRSKFATVFSAVSKDANASAEALASGYGLSSTAAIALLGDTGDLLTGFGFTQKSALALSAQVNTLAVDLASFTNFEGGAKGASDALTKALLGERESLKSLGVAILDKDVKQRVALLIAKGQRFETMRQAKAIATLSLATEQSKNAVGDFARTQAELANQERITSARTQDLKESFGKVLMPAALKLTQAIRGVIVRLTALDPTTKKVILIIGFLIAILGPLLLVIGSIALALPLLASGFAAMGAVAALALGPVGVLAGILAAAAVLVVKNWDRVKAFFAGFFQGVSQEFGPTFGRLVELFTATASAIAELFGSDGEASRNLVAFAGVGNVIGRVIGGALDLVIRGILGINELLAQVITAAFTLDFGAINVDKIKAEFMGTAADPILNYSRVDVGVNVGLDAGLTQTGATDIIGAGVRRLDVGGVAQ